MWRKVLNQIFTVLLIAGFVLSAFPASPASATASLDEDPPVPRAPESPFAPAEPGPKAPEKTSPSRGAPAGPLDKLSPELQKAVEQRSIGEIKVTIIAMGEVASAGDFLKAWSSRPVLEYTVYGGTINAADLAALAADPNVTYIKTFKPVEAPPDPLAGRTNEATGEPDIDFDAMQARLNEIFAARGLTVPELAPTGISSTTDWWGGYDVHGGDAANAAGYTGEGVKVAMVDSGVDFGHPDLYGQYAVYPEGHTYEGWPIALDPTSMRNYYYNGVTFPISDTSWYANTSDYFDVTPGGDVTFYNYWNGEVYTVTEGIAESSASGRLRYGVHPDPALANRLFGYPAVLLVDSATPYVYDTVYVDMNGDRWFNDDPDFDITGDEIANDVDVPATKENPILAWDDNWTTPVAMTVTATVDDPVWVGPWNGSLPRHGGTMLITDTWVLTGTQIWQPDGKADLSGGMIYFIADGETPIPGSDMLGYGAPFNAWWYQPDLADYDAAGIIPQNGSLVAFMLGTDYTAGGDHGTNCSTMVLAQGVIDFPAFSGGSLAAGQVQFPFAEGNTLQGLAPGAKLIAVGSVYPAINGMQGIFDAHDFIALGADGIPNTGDEAQVANYSFGDDSVFNDGWDLESRYLVNLTTNVNPNLAIAAATGNDGPGYGTIDPPASSAGVIAVGASTSYGSTQLADWGIPGRDYIMDGDLVYFSNRGPSASGANPDIMAIGFVNHVAIPVNSNGDYDGNTSLAVGGGTSYATPFVAGALADVYQAYFQKWGEWPTAETAKAILMAGADDMSYDVFSQGAGNVRADTAAMIADGETSIFTSPSTWDAGDYRGEEYKSFAHIVPGDSASKTFTVYNTGDSAESVSISDEVYELVDTQVYTMTTTPWYEWNVGPALWYGHPDYLLSTAPELAYNGVLTTVWGYTDTFRVHGPDLLVDVPAGAELMRAYVNQSWYDFDWGYYPEAAGYNLWYFGMQNWDLMLYQWDDLNANGWVWADWISPTLTDNVVNPLYWGQDLVEMGNVYSTFGWPFNEWFAPDGQGELSLINRAIYPDAPGSFIEVANPADRGAGTATNQGLVVGLQHTYGAVYIPQVLTVTLEFYQAVDWAWLDVDAASLSVPAAGADPGMATFEATVNVPEGTEPGVFEGAILVNGSVVPVQVNVAATMGDNYYYTFGNATETTPYRNGEMFSANMWYGGGYGNGDWRFQFFDLDDTSPLAEDAVLWYYNEWGDWTWEDTDPDPAVEGWQLTEHSNTPGDINPYLFGPADDGFNALDSTLFGPHGQVNLYGGTWPWYDGNYLGWNGGDWWYDTSTGGPVDEACVWQEGGWKNGLHEFVFHDALFGGSETSNAFNGEVGFFSLKDAEASVNEETGTVETTLISPWDETAVMAMGFHKRDVFNNQQVVQGAEPYSEYPADLLNAGGWFYDFSIAEEENIWIVEAWTDEGVGWPELSLFLLYDSNGDGFFNMYDTQELLDSDIDWDPYTDIWYWDPKPGNYRFVVYGNFVEPEDYFQFTFWKGGGNDVVVREADENGIIDTTPGVPMTLHLDYTLAGDGDWWGWIEAFHPIELEDYPFGGIWPNVWGCYQGADIHLTKGLDVMLEVDKELALAGETLTYTITLQNNTDGAFWPWVEVPLPDMTTYVDDSLTSSDAQFPDISNAWFDLWDHAVYWDERIDPFSSVVITFQARISNEAPWFHELVETVYPWNFTDMPVSVTTIVGYPLFLPMITR